MKKKNRLPGDKSYIYTNDGVGKTSETKKFPIEDFVQLYSHQYGKQIKLHTYKYPAKGTIKGVVYLMYNFIIYRDTG
jgi:hypothetical protein